MARDKNKSKIRITRSQRGSEPIDLDDYQENTSSETTTRRLEKKSKIPIRDRLRPVVKETELHQLESKNTEDLVRNLTE